MVQPPKCLPMAAPGRLTPTRMERLLKAFKTLLHRQVLAQVRAVDWNPHKSARRGSELQGHRSWSARNRKPSDLVLEATLPNTANTFRLLNSTRSNVTWQCQSFTMYVEHTFTTFERSLTLRSDLRAPTKSMTKTDTTLYKKEAASEIATTWSTCLVRAHSEKSSEPVTARTENSLSRSSARYQRYVRGQSLSIETI